MVNERAHSLSISVFTSFPPQIPLSFGVSSYINYNDSSSKHKITGYIQLQLTFPVLFLAGGAELSYFLNG